MRLSRSAFAPCGAGAHFRGINAGEANTMPATFKSISINDIGVITGNRRSLRLRRCLACCPVRQRPHEPVVDQQRREQQKHERQTFGRPTQAAMSPRGPSASCLVSAASHCRTFFSKRWQYLGFSVYRRNAKIMRKNCTENANNATARQA